MVLEPHIHLFLPFIESMCKPKSGLLVRWGIGALVHLKLGCWLQNIAFGFSIVAPMGNFMCQNNGIALCLTLCVGVMC